MAKDDIVELKGGFDDFEAQGKPKDMGRKPLTGDDKTDQYGIRLKVSVWSKFKLLVKKIETEALEKGDKEPTQGDVFEMAINLLIEKHK